MSIETPPQKLTIPRSKGVEICIDLLFKGQSRQVIVQELTNTYKVSVGAIDKWIKIARPVAEMRLREAEEIRIKITEETISDAVKEGLLSDIEIEMVLCKIIRGDVQVEEWVKGSPILRSVTPTEINQAARTIYQKRGSNAPMKTEISGANGDPLVPIIQILPPTPISA